MISVVFDASRSGALDASWAVGPAPFRYTDTQFGHTVTADRAARSAHYFPRTASVLFGDADDPTRFHRAVEVACGEHIIEMVELVRNPLLDRDLIVLHITLQSMSETSLPGAVESLGRRIQVLHRDSVSEACGAGIKVLRPRYRVVYTHLTGDVGYPLGSGSGLNSMQQWLRILASAVDPGAESSIPVDLDDPALRTGTVHLSGSWRAQVLRDGAAFVGYESDGASMAFLSESAPCYVRSIYMDAFLLGMMQVIWLNALADRMPVLDQGSTMDSLQTVHRSLLRFRNTMWWQHAASSGISNNLLLEFQNQQSVAVLLEELVVGVDGLSVLASEAHAERVNAALSLITLVALPLGLVMTAVQILSSDGVAWMLSALVIGLVLGLVALLHPAIRSTLPKRHQASRTISGEQGRRTDGASSP